MTFSDEDIKNANDFSKFYIDLLEEHGNSVFYYLSETATLDWFGQTVKGPRNISIFLRDQIRSTKHLFFNVNPVNEIGFRNTHIVKKESAKLTSTSKRKLNLNEPITTQQQQPASPPPTYDETTPPKQIIATPRKGHALEAGQGDGLHNVLNLQPLQGSPKKKAKLLKNGTEIVLSRDIVEKEEEEGEGDGSRLGGAMRYVTMEGHMEFRRVSSKKYQRETKWQRPCKLHVAYRAYHKIVADSEKSAMCKKCNFSGGTIYCCSNVSESTIYLIIYEGNMRCRRNLMQEFEAAADDDD